ncbi:MAG: hypothetical protein M1426_03545, partial [Patescibacteria group bacterium]|nr:hypothetical protein [Patescibacteria group bacterium]
RKRGWSLFWIPLAKGPLQGEIKLTGWKPAMTVQIKSLTAVELSSTCTVEVEYVPVKSKSVMSLPENWNGIRRTGSNLYPGIIN